MSKIDNMNDIMKYLGIFRREFWGRKGVSDEIKTSLSLIKDDIQTPIEKVI